jgi:hypothetical protein
LASRSARSPRTENFAAASDQIDPRRHDAEFHERVRQGRALAEHPLPDSDGPRILALARRDPKANGQVRPRYYCQHWEPGRWPVWGHLPRGGMPTPESPRTVVGLIADHLAQLNLRAVVTGRREPELEYLSASPTGSAATGFTRYANSPGNIYSSILACGSPTSSRSVQRPWTAPTRRCWPRAYGVTVALRLMSPTRVGRKTPTAGSMRGSAC